MSEEREPAEGGQSDDLEPENPDDEPEEGEGGEDEPLEPEADEGGEEPVDPAPRRQSRGDRQFGDLRRQLREEREARLRLEGEMRNRPAATAAQADPEAEERAFLESLVMMDPAGQARAISQRVENRVNARVTRSEVTTHDALDRIAYRELCRDEPAAQRLASKVEDTLAEARRIGQNPTRETIYNFLIGQETRAAARKTGQRQRQAGARRIAAQTTTGGGNNRSAVPAGTARRGGEESHQQLFDRIKDIPL